MKVMPPFFLENVTALTIKFSRMIHTSFTIMRLFFRKVFIILNTPLPTMGKVLYTNVVIITCSTSQHIMETLFQFVVIYKMVFT
jgi:hypothetical protein